MKLKIENHMVEIDDNMVNIVTTLNEKGYTTQFCCEGHAERKVLCTYICFEKEYDFPSLPKGFRLSVAKRKWDRRTVLDYVLNSDNLELKQIRKLDRVAQLNKWVKELESIKSEFKR